MELITYEQANNERKAMGELYTNRKNQNIFCISDLEGKQFTKLNMPNLYLPEWYLEGIFFEECNLENANLENSIISGGEFINTNLKKSNLKNCMADNTNFSLADFRGSNLDYIFFDDKTKFWGTKIDSYILPERLQAAMTMGIVIKWSDYKD